MTTEAASTGLLGKVQDYWNRRPCNIRHSNKPVGTKEYFDEVEARKYFVEPHIPGFAQFDRWKGKKVLEIGSGIGTDATNFARAGADYTGVELSSESMDLTKQRFEVYGLPGKFYVGNTEHMSDFVPVERQDLVYSFGVIHHSPYPGKILDEVKKYIDRDSEVRIMVYSKWSWKVFWIVMTYGKGQFWKMGELTAQYSEAQEGSPVTFSYSFRDLHKFFGDHGYEITEMYKDHIFPYVIPKYVKYEYQYVWYFRWIPQPLFRWLEKRLGWHTMVVAKLK
jgi:SAM-dependent methyltransferase